MKINTQNLLASYVDALRPIIYINYFDFKVVDDLIGEIANNAAIYEYNNAYGDIDFITKTQNNDCNLEGFLDYIFDEAYEENIFIILKDVHKRLKDPEIIARLKMISEKNIYQENYYATIFIVSNKLIIPRELENYITVVDMPIPSQKEIEDILSDYAKDLKLELNEDTMGELALDLKGLTEFQIIQILNLAYQDGGFIDRSDKHLILNEKEQVIKKSGMLEIINFKETIDDIGGLKNLKNWLIKKEKIFNKLDKAIKFGVDMPKGIMILGMPGCGKSLTAKATAELFNVPLLRLDVGRLLGKYVGESEENLREALKIAETISPCVMWIDEIEKAFAGIGETGGASDVTTRLFGQFLTWMQEKDSTVFTVATANNVSKLPSEFLRKGRFDEIFFVDLPNDEERRKIFEIHLKKRGKWNKKINTIKLLKETSGFNGADIEAVVKETIENAFINGKDQIITADILEVIKDSKSISETLKGKIKEVKKILEKMDIKLASDNQNNSDLN